MANESRTQILEALRTPAVDSVDLPDLNGEWIEYENRLEQFSQTLAAVGGRAVVVRDQADLLAKLSEQPAFEQAQQICSLVDGIDRANVDLNAAADPHELETVDYFIAPGQFAVAENGAVWLDEAACGRRVLPFIIQHLVVVLDRRELVANMHEAYTRIAPGETGFGVFIAGPSKTADIEQSLVIGAQGPRSFTVLLR